MRPSSSRAPRPTRAGAASSADCWERLPSRSRGAARRRDHEDRRARPRGDSAYQRGFDGRVTEYASGTSRLPAAAHTESTEQRISGGRSNSITKTSRPSSAPATSKVVRIRAGSTIWSAPRWPMAMCSANGCARTTGHGSPFPRCGRSSKRSSAGCCLSAARDTCGGCRKPRSVSLNCESDRV
jgi:hypothetical protein